MKRRITLLLAAASVLSACGSEPETVDFVWLDAVEGAIETRHALPFRFRAGAGYALVGPKHREDEFDGVPYEISLAAFISPGGAIMVHSERVADGSGASDYSNLPLANWPVDGFRAGDPVCLDIAPGDIEGEHDPEWLAEQGFDMSGGVWLDQYYLSSADNNDEIVLSLMRKVVSCREGGDPEQALTPLRETLRVEPLAE